MSVATLWRGVKIGLEKMCEAAKHPFVTCPSGSPVRPMQECNAGRGDEKQSVKKVTVKDQIGRVAGRIAAFQWYVDHPRMEDGRCRFCGTTASCSCIGNTKRNLSYWEKRLAILRAESTLTPEEVEKILKDSRRTVKKRERDEMLERLENA